MVMARSIRLLYRARKGTIRLNHNWDAINLDSAVILTAAEFIPQFDLPMGGPKTKGRPNLGAANVYVTNVGPHGAFGEAGGVEFLLHVDWGSPLDVIVTITVLENIEDFGQI
jgi:hypothetical protein